MRQSASKDECLSRVPYTSIIATVMCATGVLILTLVLAWAFNVTVEQARRTFQLDNLPWLAKMQVFFVVVAILMGIAVFILLVIGAMSTGSTRKELYRGTHGRLGGRFANAFALIASYMLNICWLICFACVTVMCFIYYIFTSLCSSISFSDSDCLDFSLFQSLVRDVSSASLVLCGGNVQQFCALSWSAFAWYFIALFSCLIIIKGLEHFMICAAANYAHITSGMKYFELKEILMSDYNDVMKADLQNIQNYAVPRLGGSLSPDRRDYRSYLA